MVWLPGLLGNIFKKIIKNSCFDNEDNVCLTIDYTKIENPDRNKELNWSLYFMNS